MDLLLEQLETRCVPTVVHINQAWLESHGAESMLLNEAGATYVLETDVSVSGTAFIVAAPNVTFDLSGHTITYGNAGSINVPNGGFEIGTTNAIFAWDTANAPGAQLIPAMPGMWGDRMLSLPNISAPQSIRSSAIPILPGNHEYAAAITPKGPYGTTVTLTVLDAEAGTVLGVGTSANVERGFAAVASFTPSATTSIELVVSVAPPAGQTAAVALDYASVAPSRDFGIMATQLWSGELPLQLQTPEIVNDYRDAANFTILNGTIRQGDAHGRASPPLFFQALPQFRVDNVSTLVTGMDTHNLDGTWGSNAIVTNSHFAGAVDRVSNRMAVVTAIGLNNFGGTVDLTDNEIVSVPQTGILVAGMPSFASATIVGNVIRQDSLVTDGYGITLAGIRNFAITDNLIDPINGRGILLDSWGRIGTENGLIEDNYVAAVERPNLEYGSSMNATALRMRNGLNRFAGLLIQRNTFAASTTSSGVKGAQGARISAFNDAGQMSESNVLIRWNTFKAIVDTSDVSYRARAFSVSRVDVGTGIRIAWNQFESNDTALGFGDSDSWQSAARDLWMGGNVIRKNADGVPRAFVSIIAGDYQTAVSDVSLPMTTVQNGALPLVQYGAGTVTNFYVTWLLMAQGLAKKLTP